MNKRVIWAIVLVVGLLLVVSCKGNDLKEQAAAIDALAGKWMAAGKIPGMAVGVIKNDRVIFLKGYGYADKKTLRPVTPRTTFFIASGAKSFTAMVMGLLVHEGKLEWDQPIRNYLPGFKMVDDFATEHLSMRDLLCHRIALPKNDRVWKRYLGTQGTRRDFMNEFANIEPLFSFRENFLYQNLGYILAAHTAETLTGITWEEMVRERIFKPLGMKNSMFTIDEMKDKGDFAVPYRREGEKELKEIAFPDTGIAGPANGIYTSAEDLTRWLRLHLGSGKIKGNRFIPEKIIKEMHTIQAAYRQYPYSPNWMTMGYGLGWIIDIYRGHYLLQHGGGVPGFTSMTAFLPFDNIGVVVLCNTSDTEVPNYLMRNIVDILLGFEPLKLEI